MTIQRTTFSTCLIIVLFAGLFVVRRLIDHDFWYAIVYLLLWAPIAFFIGSPTYRAKAEKYEGAGILQVRRKGLPFVIARVHLEGYGLLPDDGEAWDRKIQEELLGKEVFVREDHSFSKIVAEGNCRVPDAEVYPLKPLF